MSIQVSNLGTFAQYAPVIKRAQGEMSTGETVFMVPDANLGGFAGDDVTGVAKIRFYKTDVTRTTVALALTWTPSPAPCSSTKAAVCSMVVDLSNNIHVVWQGTDNSLWYNIMTYSAGTWTAGTAQNIRAANAVTNRFRALDIDWTSSGLAVMAYESLASTGLGQVVTLYCRLSDGTTWRRAWQEQITSNQFTRQGSEDVSVSFNTLGIVSSVAKILIFYTRTMTTADYGDLVKEISFNFSTGTDDSATVAGTWPIFNQNFAAGFRRGWIFKTTSNIWQVAMVAGLAQPKFMVMRLTSGAYGPPIINTNWLWLDYRKTYLSRFPRIDATVNPMTAIGCVYNDDKVMFGFITDASTTYGVATGKPGLASIVFRYDDSSEYTTSYNDNQIRPLDNLFLYGERPVAIYGGGNSRTQASDYKFDWVGWYGYPALSSFSDDFDRTVSGGLGTSSSGHTYSYPLGSSAYSVNGSVGIVTMATAGHLSQALLPVTYSDVEIFVRHLKPSSVVPTGGSLEQHFYVRYKDSTNYVLFRVFVNTDNTITLNILKRENGVDTWTAFPAVPGVTATSSISLRLQVIGSTLKVSAWLEGSAPPITWLLELTTANLSSGQIFWAASRSSGNTNVGSILTEIDGFTVAPPGANKAYFIYNNFYDAPTLVAPSPSAVQSNNSPTLQVRVQNGQLYPNVRGKIQWTLAKDAGFTVSAKTITEPDANFRYFGSTTNEIPPPVNVAYVLTASEKLNSGTWYMRARVVDDLGGSSAWSDVQSFLVQHPPTANPASPSSGSLVEFGSGSVTFNWTFTDTEPVDKQSAYQLLLTRQDTGAIVLDTGKVVSSTNSTTQTISSTFKDIPLQWSVKLWDTDDVAGPFSNPVLFTLSDAPAVVVTSPTNGATVTTARPTVTWTPTISGGRLQKAYRVYAFKANVLDLYDRVTSNGWATSSSGRVWTVSDGPVSQTSVDGASAHIAVAASSTSYGVVSDFISRDGRQSIDVTPTVAITGGGVVVCMYSRRLDAFNYYRTFFSFNPDNTISVRLEKMVNLSFTIVSTLTATGVTYTPGTAYRLIVDLQGSTFRIMVHPATSAEPSAWQHVVTDTSLTAPGKTGVVAFLGSGNTNTLPYDLKFDNYVYTDATQVVAGESGWIQGTENSFTFSANIFEDLQFYVAQVFVQDTGGLLGGSFSGIKTDWVEPALGNASVVTDDFGATVNWTDLNIDVEFIAWRVYRKYMKPDMPELDDEDTANTWILIHETDEVKSSYSYKDYLAPLNKSISYVVVQVVDRFGSLIESVISSPTTVSLTGDRYFFVPAVPIGSIASYEAAYVTGDNFTDEVEQEILHVKGRGRQVQVGDDLGVGGTLTIHLRNPDSARADRQFIQRLSKTKTGVYIKSPFGDIHLVKFGNVGVTRIAGVGTADLVDLSVPYTEVFDTLPITRT